MSAKSSKDGLVFEFSDWPPHALLADFDVDSARLKDRHKLWILDTILKTMLRKRVGFSAGVWVITLKGRASHTGSDGHNFDLSQRRIDSVRAFLLEKAGTHPLLFDRQVFGEMASLDPGEMESGMDRSVEVGVTLRRWDRRTILLVKKNNPRRPWRPKKCGEGEKQFKIQVLHGTEGDTVGLPMPMPIKPTPPFGKSARSPVTVRAGFKDLRLVIEVREVGGSDSAKYEFAGTARSLGASLGATPAVKLVDAKPHYFCAPVDLEASDFGGPAYLERTVTTGLTRFDFGPGGPWWSPRLGGFHIRGFDLGRPEPPTASVSVFELITEMKLIKVMGKALSGLGGKG